MLFLAFVIFATLLRSLKFFKKKFLFLSIKLVLLSMSQFTDTRVSQQEHWRGFFACLEDS